MRKTPVVMGVLAMVFGGLEALVNGISLVTQPFSKQMIGSMGKTFSSLPKQEGQPDVGDMLAKLGGMTEDLKLYTYLTGGAKLALGITLILVGYLLYKRRAQARSLTIAWAIAALGYLPVQLYVEVKIFQPRMLEITKKMLESAPDSTRQVMLSFTGVQGVATVVMHLLFYAPFPILLLILIGRKSAKNDLLPVM